MSPRQRSRSARPSSSRRDASTKRSLVVFGLAAAALLSLALAGLVWRRGRVAADIKREPGLSVLLVTIDTLRADAVGSYGNTGGTTPWMDRLAAEGVRFEQAHAHNVMTLPSHANILSGRYPLEHGVRDNSGFRLPRDTDTLATLLAARGYRTGAFVSAFPLDARFGLDRGFEVYDDRFLNVDTSQAFLIQQRKGTETVALARHWLEATEARPHFCWVHLYEPHFPYEPPEPFASRFRADSYLGEVAAADDALAPLLSPLLAAGKAGRTLVVLTSDHGEARGDHGEMTHGIFAYESTLRVPLILFAPRLLTPRLVREPVRHVDLLPTILDALSLPVPPGLPGRSLLGLAAGRAEAAAPTYFEALTGRLTRSWAPLFGLLRGSLKYIDLPIAELYDIASDPREQTNLASALPDRLAEMHAALERLRSTDRGLPRHPETVETRERLRSLGYLAGPPAPVKGHFTSEDDPKRLIGLDARIQELIGRRQAGDLQGAIAVADELVRLRPDMPVSFVYLGALRREAGDLEGAVSALRKAFALSPSDTSAAALLGAYLAEAGRPLEAAQLLESLAAQAEPDPDVMIARGMALARIGRHQEALATFGRAREVDPSNAMVLVDMATVHLMTHDLARARESLSAALALNPGVARAYNELGVIEEQNGRLDEAIELWKRAVRLDPRDADTLFNLGTVLLRRGRTDEARAYFERFVSVAPRALYAQDVVRIQTWLAQHPASSDILKR